MVLVAFGQWWPAALFNLALPPTLISGDAALVAAAVRHVAAQTQLNLSGAAFKRFIEVHYTVREWLLLTASWLCCVCAQ